MKCLADNKCVRAQSHVFGVHNMASNKVITVFYRVLIFVDDIDISKCECVLMYCLHMFMGQLKPIMCPLHVPDKSKSSSCSSVFS